MYMMLLIVVVASIVAFFSLELTGYVKKVSGVLPGSQFILPLLFFSFVLLWEESYTQWVLSEVLMVLRYCQSFLMTVLPKPIDGRVIANVIILSVVSLLPVWAYYYMSLRKGLYVTWAMRYRVALAFWLWIALTIVINL